MNEESHRRRDQRLRLRASARLLDDEDFEFAFTENLSTGGFFIRGAHHLRPGDLIDLDLVLPDDAAYRIQAEVRHVRSPEIATPPEKPAGAGFAIVDASSELRQALETMMTHRFDERAATCIFVQDEGIREYLQRAGFTVAPVPLPEDCRREIASAHKPVVGIIVTPADQLSYAKALDYAVHDAVLVLDDPEDIGDILTTLDLRVLALADALQK